MSINSQGTQLFFNDPDSSDGVIVEVDCVNGLTGISTPLGEEDTTCLADLGNTVEPTVFGAGSMQLTIRFDPTNESHVRLFELWRAKQKLSWGVGFSDGLGIPPSGGVDSDNLLNVPTTRSWLLAYGYIQEFPWDFAIGTRVTSNLTVRIDGEGLTFLPKSA